MMREIPRSENEKVHMYPGTTCTTCVYTCGTHMYVCAHVQLALALAQPAKPVQVKIVKPKNQTSVVLTMVFLTAYRSPTS